MIGRAARHAAHADGKGRVFTVVMVLPFILGLVAALCAFARKRNVAVAFALATVVVQVWWLFYHATDTLAIGL
jgi:uncharacterized membrane protein